MTELEERTVVTDWRGKEIAAGDTVLYAVVQGSSPQFVVAKVLEVDPQRGAAEYRKPEPMLYVQVLERRTWFKRDRDGKPRWITMANAMKLEP